MTQTMDAFSRAGRNAFVAHTVDRAHNRRQDDAWLTRRLHNPTTRFVVIWQDQVLVGDQAEPYLARLNASELDVLQSRCPQTKTDVVLLGWLGETLYFAAGIEDRCTALPGAAGPLGQFLDLRYAAQQLDHEAGALAAQAKAMVHWLRQHRYCGRCGHPTEVEEGGYVVRCCNDACGQIHFPRVDPAIIVLVTRGAACLLGRQGRWDKGRYSNVAGFVEPGESLETAVAREVWEETGIKIRAVHYHSSQPWPFPQSLMIGFTAEAESQDIHLNDGELEDAKWFTRETIRDGLVQGTLGLPSSYSISFHLLEDWFDAGECGRLRDFVTVNRS